MLEKLLPIAIKKKVKYPREDAIELRDRVINIETAVAKIELLLDTNNSNSLINKQQQASQENRNQVAHLLALLEEYKAKHGRTRTITSRSIKCDRSSQ